MAIVVNGTNIPASGNIKYGNTDINKVNVVKDGVATTVWEKITSITPPASEVNNYINISGSGVLGAITCSSHPNSTVFGASVWYVGDNNINPGFRNPSNTEQTSISIITPKDPYTKISCAFHRFGLVQGDDEKSRIWVTAVVNGATSTVEITDTYTITNASSIEIKCYAFAKGGTHHWKTEAYCCIYNVTLS